MPPVVGVATAVAAELLVAAIRCLHSGSEENRCAMLIATGLTAFDDSVRCLSCCSPSGRRSRASDREAEDRTVDRANRWTLSTRRAGQSRSINIAIDSSTSLWMDALCEAGPHCDYATSCRATSCRATSCRATSCRATLACGSVGSRADSDKVPDA